MNKSFSVSVLYCAIVQMIFTLRTLILSVIKTVCAQIVVMRDLCARVCTSAELWRRMRAQPGMR